MFKKAITMILMIFAMCLFVSTAFAQQATKVSDLVIYDPEIVSPLVYTVETGEKLDLNVQNRSREDIYFEVPMMNISVKVPKAQNQIVSLDFANPMEGELQFIIRQRGSNVKTGNFMVSDYSVKTYTSNVEGIDTSFLSNIINYERSVDMTYDYEATSETTTRSVDMQPEYEESRFIRGFW